ncbi:alpha/beta hydrolase [Fodinicola acaciae]|uniref:alpha/beta hydrolase n=1 Tax=Fodinicola acaciae TaxID=2681555 RepID=UPI001C9E8AA5|nr:alpha/beta hydrolase [Fodinicola acaciae]
MTSPYRRLQVPVPGGGLAVGVWGVGEPLTLLVHGITGSHLAWSLVAEQVAGDGNGMGTGTVAGVDLRGRGDSGSVAGPYGFARHADDCAAVLDRLGAAEVVVAGHSMGGFVSLVLADRHPERVSRLVLVDGGPPLPPPPGDTAEERIATVLGPAVQRLRMRFPSRVAYADFWRAHPAFAEWNAAIQSYVDYDLTGTEPELRSKVSEAAVREDSVDILEGDALREAWQRLRHDAVFLRAERGLLDQPVPLYPEVAPIEAKMPVRTLAGTNHYTILLSEKGAAPVAAAIRTG